LYSQKNDLSPYLVYAVILAESSFNKNVVSSAGAVGLMQVMPSTAKFIAKNLGEIEYDLFDAKTNIKFGTYYLRYLLDKFSVLETALLAYNAGEGTVKNWLKNSEYSKDGVSIFNVPFKETREYLEKILKYQKKYQKLYAKSVDK
ncbi:MAG: lytic transglycosylase domain-containing protein, partial [Clostridia bacterium]|nr:lytic transglycosylase domain-containing protein [Clostridia bacterium]